MKEHQLLIGIGIILGTALLAGSYFIAYISGWGKGWEDAADTAANHPDTCVWKEAVSRAKEGINL